MRGFESRLPALLCVRGEHAGQIRQCLAQVASGARPLASLADETGACAAVLLVRDAHPEALGRLLAGAAAALQPGQAVADARLGLYFHPSPPGEPALAFLFPGQGSQALGMLAPLNGVLPGFAERVAALDADGSWRGLINAARSAAADAALRDTRHAQPAIGLVSIALAQTLLALGLAPRFAAGHSYGELPALALAGAFDAATLLQLSVARGRLLGEAGDEAAGAMLALLADTASIEALLAEAGPGAVLANRNSPRQGVVSGELAAVARVEALARARGLRCTRLQTSCAFHSPLMASAAAHWQAALAAAPLQPPAGLTVLANVSARPHPASAASVRDLLARQVEAPVRWQASVEHLHSLGARVFVEVGPGRTLTELAGQILKDRPHVALACDPGKADPREHLLQLLARLVSLGLRPALQHFALDVSAFTPTQATARLLPSPPLATARRPLPPVNALNHFLDVNGRVMTRFFEQQSSLVDLCADSQAGERQQLFTALVQANQQALESYLQTQQQAVLGRPAEAALPAAASAASPAPVLAPTLAHAPVAPVAPLVTGPLTPAAPAGSEPWFRSMIANLTGFPEAMVRADSDFEGELGLDSLTMAEVWFALVDEFPQLDSQRDAFRQCRRISDAVALIASLGDAPAAVAEPPPPEPRPVVAAVPKAALATARAAPAAPAVAPVVQGPLAALRDEIVARIAVAKGLAADAIAPDADFERELGLDVFTRAELCDELVQRRPALAVAGRELVHASSVAGLLALCGRVLGLEDAEGQPERLGRHVRVALPVPLPAHAAWPAHVLLAGAAGPLFDQLHATLLGHGVAVDAWHVSAAGFRPSSEPELPPIGMEEVDRLTAALPAPAAASALLFVAGSGLAASHSEGAEGDWSASVEAAATGAFVLAKALCRRELAWFGVLGSAHAGPAWTASRGVARTLAREWPATRVRSLWLEDAALPAGAMDAGLLARAMDVFCAGPSEQDLVLRGGRLFQHSLQARPSELRPALPPALGPSSTLLLLGGGDGITAEVAVALAARYQCRIAIIGRTACPAAYPYPEAGTEEALRTLLIAELHAAPDGSGRPAAERLRERLRSVARQRAVFSTCQRIAQAGGRCHHEAADATQREQMVAALARIRQACGPIHGVVHGVGVTEDALLARKSVASFRRVLRSKTESVALMRELLQGEPLAFAFLFSSLSVHAGTPGQVDYVAANEVLGAVAEAWNAEASYPVRALLWSVWSEAGLASASLVRQMARLGLPGIATAQGVAQLQDELARGDKDEPWVLLAPGATLAFALNGDTTPVPAQVAPAEEGVHA
ncbi:MAG TPA: acyltransferase domain-containing protein [Ideonella sp.]|uniref:acyltransferase domain-containing protein n=1 Tax=Ideonella sp. TaxID=1929293 RepID=UPI002C9C6FE3|nr:acyltransferase domain-containing protein [Ideonella sp.]HSI48685.1 acyltransferase domain-containing protein [Ideonella sp.]